ncbi:MAG: hypothetical protein NT166_03185 [Candidatus Aminicenantes bacterium]|nr:hypothetical protein [Candidatus Aminicenantes bacterium]
MESNRKVFASADETACDFLIDDYKVEVGGKKIFRKYRNSRRVLIKTYDSTLHSR